MRKTYKREKKKSKGIVRARKGSLDRRNSTLSKQNIQSHTRLRVTTATKGKSRKSSDRRNSKRTSKLSKEYSKRRIPRDLSTKTTIL